MKWRFYFLLLFKGGCHINALQTEFFEVGHPYTPPFPIPLGRRSWKQLLSKIFFLFQNKSAHWWIIWWNLFQSKIPGAGRHQLIQLYLTNLSGGVPPNQQTSVTGTIVPHNRKHFIIANIYKREVILITEYIRATKEGVVTLY